MAGRVVDELGRPLAGALVIAVGLAERPSTRTGKDGRFAFPVLPPGRYVLVALRARTASEPVVLDGGSFPGRLRLVIPKSPSLI